MTENESPCCCFPGRPAQDLERPARRYQTESMTRADALHQVKDRIAAACERAGRDIREVTLVAVGKTYPSEVIREVCEAGQNVFGENRIQEAEKKVAELAELHLEWHLIGSLQTNKARKAVANFDWIHSVDRPKLAEALEKAASELGRTRPILIQVNLAGELQKGGITPDELETLGETLESCTHLVPHGLMIIPPFGLRERAIRKQFAGLRELGEKHAAWLAGPDGKVELSMGMTSDFEWAIEEGATFVRVGTAIFGKR